jgi:predicted HD phosphohydrolase
MTAPRASFRRMDQAIPSDWAAVRDATWRLQPRVAENVLDLLRALDRLDDGFAVSQLTHALQTATRAERARASEELVLAALCHDVGKRISIFGHAHVSAAILRPYVSPDVFWIVDNHQAIQGRHYRHYFGGDPDAWRALERHAAFGQAWQFVEEWDQTSFDPDYPAEPLDHFEPLVRELFARPRDRR